MRFAYSCKPCYKVIGCFVNFRFGEYVKDYKEETNKELTFRDLAGTETATPSECMLLLEMTRKNQAKVYVFVNSIMCH